MVHGIIDSLKKNQKINEGYLNKAWQQQHGWVFLTRGFLQGSRRALNRL